MAGAGTVFNERYRLDRLIGQGGFAQVFLATDLLLERRVAVKVLDSDLAQVPGMVQRFTSEARTVATLRHPNVVAIFDIGQDQGAAYLVMEYIDGGSLYDRLAQHVLPSVLTVSSYLQRVAGALDYAHVRGIVHRDVKPANMLVDEHEQLYLSDFGIAKVLDASATTGLTRPLGTVTYMAPEQFDGRVSPASDVYALGCVLFELLTGQTPYRGSVEQVVAGHLAMPIPSLTDVGGRPVPTALQPVLVRALAKRQDERYQSAGALARAFNTAVTAIPSEPASRLHDVHAQRIQQPTTSPMRVATNDAPVASQPTEVAGGLSSRRRTGTHASLTAPWSARIAAGVVLLALAIAIAFVAGIAAVGLRSSNPAGAGDAVGSTPVTATMPTVVLPADNPPPTTPPVAATAPVPTVALSAADPRPTTPPVAATATRPPTAAPTPAPHTAQQPNAASTRLPAPTVTPSATLPTVPTATAVTRAPFQGQPLATLTGHTDYVIAVAWSPDGKTLASASYDHTVRLWSAEGTMLKTLTGHTDAVTSVAWSPDGQTLVTGAADNTVRLWTARGEPLSTFYGHRNSVFAVAWSPDGRVIASGSGKISSLDVDLYEIRLWSVDGRPLATIAGHTDSIMSLDWSPDSQVLASASADQTVRLWTANGKPLATLVGHTDRVVAVSWSRDGRTLASASGDGTVRLWSPEGRSISVLSGHVGYVTGVAWSPDGKTLATSSYDQTVQLWSLGGRRLAVLSGHTDRVRGVAWSRDGSRLASASLDGTVRLWR